MTVMKCANDADSLVERRNVFIKCDWRFADKLVNCGEDDENSIFALFCGWSSSRASPRQLAGVHGERWVSGRLTFYFKRPRNCCFRLSGEGRLGGH